MSAVKAVTAGLKDLQFDFPNRAATVHASIAIGDLGRFFHEIGVPDPESDKIPELREPQLLLVASRWARHPERDEHLIAEAAVNLLDGIVNLPRDQAPRLPAALIERLRAITERALDLQANSEVRA